MAKFSIPNCCYDYTAFLLWLMKTETGKEFKKRMEIKA
jgi:hypothetical protein